MTLEFLRCVKIFFSSRKQPKNKLKITLKPEGERRKAAIYVESQTQLSEGCLSVVVLYLAERERAI